MLGISKIVLSDLDREEFYLVLWRLGHFTLSRNNRNANSVNREGARYREIATYVESYTVVISFVSLIYERTSRGKKCNS